MEIHTPTALAHARISKYFRTIICVEPVAKPRKAPTALHPARRYYCAPALCIIKQSPVFPWSPACPDRPAGLGFIQPRFNNPHLFLSDRNLRSKLANVFRKRPARRRAIFYPGLIISNSGYSTPRNTNNNMHCAPNRPPPMIH